MGGRGTGVARGELTVVLVKLRVMAYDQELADRIRLLIGGDPALMATVTEKIAAQAAA